MDLSVIYLPGVFPQECNQFDLFECEIHQNPSTPQTNHSNLPNLDSPIKDDEIDENNEIIPSSFRDMKDWPKSSNYPCWNCVMNYEGFPIPMPIKMDRCDGVVEFSTIGFFCSFPCIARYIITHCNTQRMRNQRLLMLKELYYKIHNHRPKSIEPAPFATERKKLGGTKYTDIEFKEHISHLVILD